MELLDLLLVLRMRFDSEKSAVGSAGGLRLCDLCFLTSETAFIISTYVAYEFVVNTVEVRQDPFPLLDYFFRGGPVDVEREVLFYRDCSCDRV